MVRNYLFFDVLDYINNLVHQKYLYVFFDLCYNIQMKNKHGGVRAGAGRKKNTGKFKEKTQVMRIPISFVNNVSQALKEYKKEIDKFSVPTPNAPDVSIPFFPLEFRRVSHHLRMII